MFTGIIEETGIVKSFIKNSNGADITIQCEKVLQDTKIGDSIAINGCCQTVVALGNDFFRANVSDETLNVTNFNLLKSGTPVNLERALTPTSRMGGHIVQGHVDCTGKFIKKEQLNDFYNLYFKIPTEQCKYVVKKGSIAINGISLTVADISGNIFHIAVIPHTFAQTTLSTLKIGDLVNIETDILGKYIEKLLSVSDNSAKSNIDENFLKVNGFM